LGENIFVYFVFFNKMADHVIAASHFALESFIKSPVIFIF